MDKDVVEKRYERIKEVANSAYETARKGISSLSESVEDKIFRERFDEIKEALRKTWPSLSDADLNSIKRQRDGFIILLAEKYGETKEAASQKIDHILEAFKE